MSLNWNKWVRQIHRWLSIAFTVAVIVNIVAVVQGKYTSRSVSEIAFSQRRINNLQTVESR
jgi:hypothetical protein